MGQGLGEQRVTANGYGVSLGGNYNVLELDCGDSTQVYKYTELSTLNGWILFYEIQLHKLEWQEGGGEGEWKGRHHSQLE